MNNLQETILNIFKEQRIATGTGLMQRNIDNAIRKLDRRSQDESPEAINFLINSGYIAFNAGWYILNQIGYDYLYRHLTVQDTEDIIKNILRVKQLRPGNVIMQNWFTGELPKLNRYHFNNFNDALQNLISANVIEERDNNYWFTQIGYDAIY